MSIGPTIEEFPNGYCLWTLADGVWTRSDHCLNGCKCAEKLSKSSAGGAERVGLSHSEFLQLGQLHGMRLSQHNVQVTEIKIACV